MTLIEFRKTLADLCPPILFSILILARNLKFYIEYEHKNKQINIVFFFFWSE